MVMIFRAGAFQKIQTFGALPISPRSAAQFTAVRSNNNSVQTVSRDFCHLRSDRGGS